jgi:hypothetical protein
MHRQLNEAMVAQRWHTPSPLALLACYLHTSPIHLLFTTHVWSQKQNDTSQSLTAVGSVDGLIFARLIKCMYPEPPQVTCDSGTTREFVVLTDGKSLC